MKLGRYKRELSAALAYAALLILIGVIAPSFFSAANVRDLALNNAPVLLVAVGMTLGTGVTDSWDRTLLAELSSEWGPGGYLLDNGPGTMECPEVADSILAVLAAPTFMPYVAVLPDPARAAGIGQAR